MKVGAKVLYFDELFTVEEYLSRNRRRIRHVRYGNEKIVESHYLTIVPEEKPPVSGGQSGAASPLSDSNPQSTQPASPLHTVVIVCPPKEAVDDCERAGYGTDYPVPKEMLEYLGESFGTSVQFDVDSSRPLQRLLDDEEDLEKRANVLLFTSHGKRVWEPEIVDVVRRFVDRGGVLLFHAYTEETKDSDFINYHNTLISLEKVAIGEGSTRDGLAREEWSNYRCAQPEAVDPKVRPFVTGIDANKDTFLTNNESLVTVPKRMSQYVLASLSSQENDPSAAALVAFPYGLGKVLLFTNWQAFGLGLAKSRFNRVLLCNVIHYVLERKYPTAYHNDCTWRAN